MDRRPLALAAVLVAGVASVGVLALSLGTPTLGPGELVEVTRGGGERLPRLGMLKIRLPRLLLGLLAGACLALAGALLQDGLRNPLAGPELLGVSAGAAFVTAVVVVGRVGIPLAARPWAALAGALAGGAVVLAATGRQREPVRVVLIGAAVSALLHAGVVTVISLGTAADVNLFYFFFLGSLANRTWPALAVVAPWALVGIPAALLCARPLNVLRLGDDVAEGVGLHVVRVRRLLLVLAAALTAAVIAVCGPIAFVALLAPHAARALLQTSDARQVLPASALLGALLLASADLVARQALAPAETPVGVWTTLCGVPALLVLVGRWLDARTIPA